MLAFLIDPRMDRFHQRALAGTTRTPEQRVIGRQSLGETPRVVEQGSALLGNTLQTLQIETVDGFDRRQTLSLGMPDKSIDCQNIALQARRLSDEYTYELP